MSLGSTKVTSTVLFVPINQTGTYTLLTHSTLFGGNSTTEPITLAAKFTDISPKMISQNVQVTYDSKDDSVDTSETKTEFVNTMPTDSESDSSFGIGIIIGIIIGIVIGAAALFIIRKNQPKIEQGL